MDRSLHTELIEWREEKLDGDREMEDKFSLGEVLFA